jgi:hypothetical protein
MTISATAHITILTNAGTIPIKGSSVAGTRHCCTDAYHRKHIFVNLSPNSLPSATNQLVVRNTA